jgi:hypothetical protein
MSVGIGDVDHGYRESYVSKTPILRPFSYAWYAYADLTDFLGIAPFEHKEVGLDDFFSFHVLGVIAIGLIWYFI